MSQNDVYILLKNKRISGDDSYYSTREIMRSLNGKGVPVTLNSVNNSVLKLRMFGFLDMRLDTKKEKRITYPFAVYRVKKEYLD